MHRFWGSATRRRFRWAPNGDSATDLLGWPQRMAGSVLLEFRVVWYASVDVGVLFLLSCISALGDSLSGEACRGLGAAVVGIVAAQLVLCVVIRPFTTRLSHAYGCVTLLLTLTSASTQLFAVTRLSASDTASLSATMTAAAACDLMNAALGIVRLLLTDLPSAFKGAYYLFREMVSSIHAADQKETEGAETSVSHLCREEHLVGGRNPQSMHVEEELVPVEAVTAAMSYDFAYSHHDSGVAMVDEVDGQLVGESAASPPSIRHDDWAINGVTYYMTAIPTTTIAVNLSNSGELGEGSRLVDEQWRGTEASRPRLIPSPLPAVATTPLLNGFV